MALLTPEVSAILPDDADLARVKKMFLDTPFNHIHVLDPEGQWLGLIVRKSLTDAEPEALARDLVLPGGRYLLSTTSMQDAVKIASEVTSELLPVVESGSHRFLGTVAKSDLVGVLQNTSRSLPDQAP